MVNLITASMGLIVRTLLALFLLLMAGIASADPLFHQVRLTKLRSQPQHWATAIADLKFGDVLNVINEEKDWFKVKTTDGKEGYLHASALTTKKIILNSAQRSISDLAVDENTVSLAGKGFGSNVEKMYREKNKQTNFAAVDAIQGERGPDGEAVVAFIRDGKLNEF